VSSAQIKLEGGSAKPIVGGEEQLHLGIMLRATFHHLNHTDWFYDDNVHPNPDGSMYYTSFVAKEILKTLDKK